MTLNALKDILTEQGIRISIQRLKILEYLSGSTEHPSADNIYRNLKASVPSLSKATVYNTLGFLSAKGIVREIPLHTGEARYDLPKDAHHHFYCQICGRIIDISEAVCAVKMKGLPGFKVTGTEVVLRGTCDSCSNGSEKSA